MFDCSVWSCVSGICWIATSWLMMELSLIPDPSPRLERLIEDVMDELDIRDPSRASDSLLARPSPRFPFRPAEREAGRDYLRLRFSLRSLGLLTADEALGELRGLVRLRQHRL